MATERGDSEGIEQWQDQCKASAVGTFKLNKPRQRPPWLPAEMTAK